MENENHQSFYRPSSQDWTPDLQHRFGCLIKSATEGDVTFACLKGLKLDKLTPSQRSALSQIAEMASHLGETTRDKQWGKVARLIHDKLLIRFNTKATNSLQTK